MSDVRFIIIGVALVFVGFIVLGVLGENFHTAALESNEFGICYEYSDDKAPVKIDCSIKVAEQTMFFSIVVGFIGAGIISLIKGVKGNWDNKVNPKDMVGPGRRENEDSEND